MRSLNFFTSEPRTYEDTYSGWLSLFKEVAEAPNGDVVVRNAPGNWSTLLHYLGEPPPPYRHRVRRHEVEADCAAEPVLVDALWRADMKWGGPRNHITEKAFPIATYSGFWRPEVLQFISEVHHYVPKKTKCVLVPCAADKPYPSPLHKAVKEAVGDEYELIVVSSVIGVAPEGLWHRMPEYDAGLPFFERVRHEVYAYFAMHGSHYSHILDYTDMLSEDVQRGLRKGLDMFRTYRIQAFSQDGFADHVRSAHRGGMVRPDYENLLDPAFLTHLKQCADDQRAFCRRVR